MFCVWSRNFHGTAGNPGKVPGVCGLKIFSEIDRKCWQVLPKSGWKEGEGRLVAPHNNPPSHPSPSSRNFRLINQTSQAIESARAAESQSSSRSLEEDRPDETSQGGSSAVIIIVIWAANKRFEVLKFKFKFPRA